MNKQLFKLLLSLKKTSNQGLSLTELLVALVMGGIVIAAGTSGFINILNLDRETESKSTRLATLAKAVGYIQTDIKGAVSVTQDSGSNCSPDSNQCLVLSYPDGSEIYYGYKNIAQSTSSVYLKPGLLLRQEYDDTGSPVLKTGQTSEWEEEYTVIADGLISVNEINPNPSCNQDLPQWSGTNNTVYGDNGTGKGGFRFCLGDATANNRLARVFLYGHITGGNENNVIEVNTVGFGRAN